MNIDRNSPNTENMSKVVFNLEKSDLHDHATESLWASPVGDNQYQLENSPFYAHGVSYEDVVNTAMIDGHNVFQSVAQKGGHSTYRIFPLDGVSNEKIDEFWAELKEFGCSYERATDYLIAVDAPPPADIYAVYAALERGLSAGIWDFEEGHCGHTLR